MPQEMSLPMRHDPATFKRQEDQPEVTSPLATPERNSIPNECLEIIGNGIPVNQTPQLSLVDKAPGFFYKLADIKALDYQIAEWLVGARFVTKDVLLDTNLHYLLRVSLYDIKKFCQRPDIGLLAAWFARVIAENTTPNFFIDSDIKLILLMAKSLTISLTKRLAHYPEKDIITAALTLGLQYTGQILWAYLANKPSRRQSFIACVKQFDIKRIYSPTAVRRQHIIAAYEPLKSNNRAALLAFLREHFATELEDIIAHWATSEGPVPIKPKYPPPGITSLTPRQWLAYPGRDIYIPIDINNLGVPVDVNDLSTQMVLTIEICVVVAAEEYHGVLDTSISLSERFAQHHLRAPFNPIIVQWFLFYALVLDSPILLEFAFEKIEALGITADTLCSWLTTLTDNTPMPLYHDMYSILFMAPLTENGKNFYEYIHKQLNVEQLRLVYQPNNYTPDVLTSSPPANAKFSVSEFDRIIGCLEPVLTARQWLNPAYGSRLLFIMAELGPDAFTHCLNEFDRILDPEGFTNLITYNFLSEDDMLRHLLFKYSQFGEVGRLIELFEDPKLQLNFPPDRIAEFLLSVIEAHSNVPCIDHKSPHAINFLEGLYQYLIQHNHDNDFVDKAIFEVALFGVNTLPSFGCYYASLDASQIKKLFALLEKLFGKELLANYLKSSVFFRDADKAIKAACLNGCYEHVIVLFDLIKHLFPPHEIQTFIEHTLLHRVSFRSHLYSLMDDNFLKTDYAHCFKAVIDAIEQNFKDPARAKAIIEKFIGTSVFAEEHQGLQVYRLATKIAHQYDIKIPGKANYQSSSDPSIDYRK